MKKTNKLIKDKWGRKYKVLPYGKLKEGDLYFDPHDNEIHKWEIGDWSLDTSSYIKVKPLFKKRKIKLSWTCCDSCHKEHRNKFTAWLHWQIIKHRK